MIYSSVDDQDNTFTLSGGNDRVDGGAGHDRVIVEGDYQQAIQQLQSNANLDRNEHGVISEITLQGDNGTETLSNIEEIVFQQSNGELKSLYLDGRNNGPDAADDRVSGTEDTVLTIDASQLIANDFDFDNDCTNGYRCIGRAKRQRLEIDQQTGQIRFTPNANYNSSTDNAYDTQSALVNGACRFLLHHRRCRGSDASRPGLKWVLRQLMMGHN